ncbi:MAG: diguanylate cyclase [Syntrophobacterales bacterium]|jgi:predicted Fe-Mo cluster-binding NifX family protein|nr:diguanylate cyclase [Syntrophobacterales bacterium]
MKVAFAVQKDEGMESTVYNHFGSAPAFVTIDTATERVVTISNADVNHVHGACNPIMAIGGQDVDAVVVGGIGAGAIRGLNSRGIRVYGAVMPTVKGNMEMLKAGELPELTMQHACGGHGGGCAH